MSLEKFLDQSDDGVDPRVQVELERLNSATDEINKLEVDLDEARNQFRQLLQESTSRIDNCAKKLGNCIAKVRPYYDARIKAKEALQETQKAAANFERANSAHAAAKEMVYLAEEGLKAEGRTFDHAWQEMLNHATMRVNESESERTRSEAEHKRTSQNYQLAEIRVRTLQKELKRAITKSRPYYELKIHYNQLLEKQKVKVKNLEKQVAEVKLTYAHTLKNLEQISDEIHKGRGVREAIRDFHDGRSDATSRSSSFVYPSPLAPPWALRLTPAIPKTDGESLVGAHSRKTRQKKRHNGETELGIRSEGVGAESNSENGVCRMNNLKSDVPDCAKIIKSYQSDSIVDIKTEGRNVGDDSETGKHCRIYGTVEIMTPVSETHSSTLATSTTLSSQPDTDIWSEQSDVGNLEVSPNSENDSSITGPPDTESEDEIFKLPQCLTYNGSSKLTERADDLVSDLKGGGDSNPVGNLFEHISQGVSPKESHSTFSGPEKRLEKKSNLCFEGVGICSFPVQTEFNVNFNEGIKNNESNVNSGWTEIKLSSPEEETFSTMKVIKNRSELEEVFDIPYAPLSEFEGDITNSNGVDGYLSDKKAELIVEDMTEKSGLSGLCGLGNVVTKKEGTEEDSETEKEDINVKSLKGTPRRLNLRRQSLDVLWNNTAGEKVKEILSQSIMKLNISSLTERKSADSKMGEGNESENENSVNNVKESDGTYESNLTSQFGIHFFNRKNSKVEDDVIQVVTTTDEKKPNGPQESISTHIGGFISRKEKFFTKKVPSPLEKTLNYLNVDEESNSDNESLASSDMLTDEQLSSLILDRDLSEIYQDLI